MFESNQPINDKDDKNYKKDKKEKKDKKRINKGHFKITAGLIIAVAAAVR